MKKIILLLFSISICIGLKAISGNIYNVETPGTLLSLIDPADLNTITNITVTGTMDARDFRALEMKTTALQHLDISNITIAEYTGTEGTIDNVEVTYPANTIPEYFFTSKTTLLSILFPTSTTGFGRFSMSGCSNLTSIEIPESVVSYGNSVFKGCSSLTSITINNPVPVDLTGVTDIFEGVNSSCIITYPIGSEDAYSDNSSWPIDFSANSPTSSKFTTHTMHSSVTLRTHGNTITVCGASIGSTLDVFNSSGQYISTHKITSLNTTLNALQPGMYILNIEGQSFKLVF